jgi:ATP-dependent RNA helicase DDX49/DBP8
MSTLFGQSKNSRSQNRKERRKSDDAEGKISGDTATTTEATSESKSSDAVTQETIVSTEGSINEVAKTASAGYDFASLGLSNPLVASCRALGFRSPTPVQRAVIPLILQGKHVMALASTGSGKTAAFALPILQLLSEDPYSIFAVVLSPTRELALQIHEQFCALGAHSIQVRSTLLTGGKDHVVQTCELANLRPHVIIATPGRLAYILRGPKPPNVSHVRFVVLDEADRLLSPVGNFERDVAEILLQTQYTVRPNGKHMKNKGCQTLLFSATMTQSLEQAQRLASAGEDSVPLELVAIDQDGQASIQDINSITASQDPKLSSDIVTAAKIPSGLIQEYIFMPSRVRDAYLVTAVRNMMRQFRVQEEDGTSARRGAKGRHVQNDDEDEGDDDDDTSNIGKARSAIIFVPTCEKAARLEALLLELKMDCVALHGLLTQDRRMASLMKFKSQQSHMLIATDVASRGLDIPEVDLVINMELPRNAEDYIHRVGRTARAGRRGLAVSLVGERDISLVHAVEKLTGRPLEKCERVTDTEAVKFLSSVTKASRLAKIKMAEYGFEDMVQKRKAWRTKAKEEKRIARKAAARTTKRQKIEN